MTPEMSPFALTQTAIADLMLRQALVSGIEGLMPSIDADASKCPPFVIAAIRYISSYSSTANVDCVTLMYDRCLTLLRWVVTQRSRYTQNRVYAEAVLRDDGSAHGLPESLNEPLFDTLFSDRRGLTDAEALNQGYSSVLILLAKLMYRTTFYDERLPNLAGESGRQQLFVALSGWGEDEMEDLVHLCPQTLEPTLLIVGVGHAARGLSESPSLAWIYEAYASLYRDEAVGAIASRYLEAAIAGTLI